VTPCARLHPVPGVHAPGCTCTRDCPDHEGHCRGCAPAEATRGLLCDRDSRILRGMLGAEEGLDPDHPVHGLPWAWEHLAVAYPSLTQAPGGGGSSIDDPEAERLAAVLSLRSDIAERLLYWTFAVMNASGRAGPEIPATERLSVRRCAPFLLAQAEVLEVDLQVAAAWQELADLMSRAHALAPWRPAPTQIQGIPCRCGAMALHDHGSEITCWACRTSYDREHYRALTVVFARRFADDPRALQEHGRGRLATSREGFGGRP
jgi:hypothetical protein